ncbi:MAG: radical SAM protein [Deltaproteobacteria bacterium]|nr:MAG: radical SAM protein [Deltaproteobacteria bacterium]
MTADPRRNLQQLAFSRCVPVNATIEVTLRCNLKCVHCYNFDRAQPLPIARAAAELSGAEIVDAIDQLAAAGALFLTFTGGEALLHPQIYEFVRHAVARRFSVAVKTNGMHLVDRARALRDAGCGRVDVSVYGASAATHDAFTLAPGSFDRTVAGVRAALDVGMRVHLNLCLVRTNAHEVADMVALAQELGVGCGIDPQITRRYDGTDEPLDLRVDRDTLRALYRGPLAPFLSAASCSRDAAPQCSCARSVVAIASNGDVYPCIGAPIRAGNLREQSFADIWASSPVFERIRGLRLADFAACAPCPDRPWCRRSSGVVYVNTGDYTGPESWTCMEASVLREIAQERAAASASAAPAGEGAR